MSTWCTEIINLTIIFTFTGQIWEEKVKFLCLFYRLCLDLNFLNFFDEHVIRIQFSGGQCSSSTHVNTSDN